MLLQYTKPLDKWHSNVKSLVQAKFDYMYLIKYTAKISNIVKYYYNLK